MSQPALRLCSPLSEPRRTPPDTAGHAVETTRAGVEQAVDPVREHVGPLAEQVKEQA
jgi:hypothetical protein